MNDLILGGQCDCDRQDQSDSFQVQSLSANSIEKTIQARFYIDPTEVSMIKNCKSAEIIGKFCSNVIATRLDKKVYSSTLKMCSAPILRSMLKGPNLIVSVSSSSIMWPLCVLAMWVQIWVGGDMQVEPVHLLMRLVNSPRLTAQCCTNLLWGSLHLDFTSYGIISYF